jgi:hypothetical protein
MLKAYANKHSTEGNYICIGNIEKDNSQFGEQQTSSFWFGDICIIPWQRSTDEWHCVALMTKCIYRFNKRVYDKQFFY